MTYLEKIKEDNEYWIKILSPQELEVLGLIKSNEL